ncbi:MAG TPA: phosphohistidine phosphatase SixA [Gemmatimonadaceae bacterium]
MQLLVIRHATAENPATVAATGEDDAARPLSKEGKRMMKRVAAGLAELVDKLDVIAASPLVRAQQTAQIVAKAYNDLPVETVNALLPENEPSALVPWLQQYPTDNVVAIVGHEPHLGILVTWLMTGLKASRVVLKKGSVCLLEFSDTVAGGSATLHWLLTPSELRRIGR